MAAILRAEGVAYRYPQNNRGLVPISLELQAGDRLEVYRPLLKDPRTARREAVAQGTVLGRSGR